MKVLITTADGSLEMEHEIPEEEIVHEQISNAAIDIWALTAHDKEEKNKYAGQCLTYKFSLQYPEEPNVYLSTTMPPFPPDAMGGPVGVEWEEGEEDRAMDELDDEGTYTDHLTVVLYVAVEARLALMIPNSEIN